MCSQGTATTPPSSTAPTSPTKYKSTEPMNSKFSMEPKSSGHKSEDNISPNAKETDKSSAQPSWASNTASTSATANKSYAP